MTREEIVTALRCVAVCGGYFSAAADLFESQQREIEALRQANEGLRLNLDSWVRLAERAIRRAESPPPTGKKKVKRRRFRWNKNFQEDKDMNEQMYIVRCDRAGVFFGAIKERSGTEAAMTNVRKLWSWDGAAAVEQLAVDGTSAPGDCKFTVTVPEMVVTGVIQVIPCTEKAAASICGVKAWKI